MYVYTVSAKIFTKAQLHTIYHIEPGIPGFHSKPRKKLFASSQNLPHCDHPLSNTYDLGLGVGGDSVYYRALRIPLTFILPVGVNTIPTIAQTRNLPDTRTVRSRANLVVRSTNRSSV